MKHQPYITMNMMQKGIQRKSLISNVGNPYANLEIIIKVRIPILSQTKSPDSWTFFIIYFLNFANHHR